VGLAAIDEREKKKKKKNVGNFFFAEGDILTLVFWLL
jgi:hypothetical protein